MLGASVAPTIEPVAKITAAFAPVSACAAARRTTLERARASPETPSAAVISIIGYVSTQSGRMRSGLVDSTYYEARPPLDQPMQMGARYASVLSLSWSGRTPASDYWPASRRSRPTSDRRLPPAPPRPRCRAHPIQD